KQATRLSRPYSPRDRAAKERALLGVGPFSEIKVGPYSIDKHIRWRDFERCGFGIDNTKTPYRRVPGNCSTHFPPHVFRRITSPLQQPDDDYTRLSSMERTIDSWLSSQSQTLDAWSCSMA